MNDRFPSAVLAEQQAPASMRALDSAIHGFKTFQVIRSGYVSGLFDWLGAQDGPVAKADIVSALQLRGAHAGAWLQSLTETGCLAMNEGGYALNPQWRDVLVSDSPWYMGQAVADLAEPGGRWSELGRFMREDGHQGLRGIAQADAGRLAGHPLRSDALALSDCLSRHPVASGAASLLCFDAGSGLLAAQLCRVLPLKNATLVVPQDQLEQAMAMVQKHGVASRCRVQAGSPLEFSADGDYDLVVMFHALYSVRRRTNDALAAAVAHLAPGGTLCAAHWFCLEACEPAPGGISQLDQAVITDFHPMCHVETFCDRLTALGLGDAVKQDMAGEYGTVKLHLARKP